MLSNIDQSKIAYWWAWREGWEDWKPVSEIEGLTEAIVRPIGAQPPRVPEDKPSQNDANPSNKDSKSPLVLTNKVLQTDESHAQGLDREFISRSKKRFNRRIEVTIIGENGQTFKTFTHDISVGGMNFVDSIPFWVAGYFTARLSKPNNKQQIELRCCLVENQKPGERFRVAFLPLENIVDEKNLEMWLAA